MYRHIIVQLFLFLVVVLFRDRLHMAQCNLDGLKDARRSRTTARSESSTSRSTHRPAIESSSSSTLLASSMMVHVDDDLVAM